jgi:hypothetical protein
MMCILSEEHTHLLTHYGMNPTQVPPPPPPQHLWLDIIMSILSLVMLLILFMMWSLLLMHLKWSEDITLATPSHPAIHLGLF